MKIEIAAGRRRLQLCRANVPELGPLAGAHSSARAVVNTRGVVQPKDLRAEADIRGDSRAVACIQEAVRTRQTLAVLHIQEVVGKGNKPHPENTCGHRGRDGNPVDKHREQRTR